MSQISTRVTRVRRGRRRDGPDLPCSFCGGPGKPGVQGRDALICATCVDDAYTMLHPVDPKPERAP